MNLPPRPLAAVGLSGALLVLALAGCQKAPPPLAKTKDPEVVVAKPTTGPVTDHEDFTGHLEPTLNVEFRAQVTGYLKSANFQEGTDVKEGDLLFEIDPRQYETEFARASAAVTQAEARLDRLNRDYNRVVSVEGRGTVTQEEVDRIAGDRAEARAAVGVAIQVRELARLNVGFTKIRAPFSGRIGRRLIDPDNLVKANETALATLVKLDPIYATFDIDERTTLRLRRLIEEGKLVSARERPTQVLLALADQDKYEIPGVVTFIDNRVEAGTGTLRVRATVANPKFLLSPGMFVRIRLPVGDPRPCLLVPEEALGSDQGQRYVFVLNEKDEVVYRPVTLGPQVEKLRVIEPPVVENGVVKSGLSADDRVIVSGLQRVRPGVKVAARAQK